MTKTSQDEAKRGARALSSLGASAGGRARAERLSPAERKAIAARAAAVRWGSTAVPASNDGELVIGDRIIKCAVTEAGTRLINQETFMAALGRARKAKGGTGARSSPVPAFLSAANLRPYISAELQELAQPILYAPVRGGRAYGYRAELLPAVCEVYLDARRDGRLLKSQQSAAKAAELLIRGLARVGIIGLVDEATGYQDTRARNELQRILEAHVVVELRPWLKFFPESFFKEVYRLHGWQYRPGTAKRASGVGKFVTKYIFDQLAPAVQAELERLDSRTDHRYPRPELREFMPVDTGNAELDKQIATVTTVMRVADDVPEFEEFFERASAPSEPRPPLVVDVPPEAG